MSERRREIERMHAEITAAALEHSAAHGAGIARFVERTTAVYAALVDGLVAELRGDAATAHWVQPALDVLREYLVWLQWTSWNAASLAPLAGGDGAADAAAAATLAYAAGRLVDDGLDDHHDFKGTRATFRALFERLEPAAPARPARPLSVFLGLCAFQYALRSLRRAGDDEGALARFIERRFARVSSGVLAELRAPGAADRRTYESVVRRKAVNYNMMLYAPLLQAGGTEHRARALRALAEIDRLAQVVNDHGDRGDDMLHARLNGFGGSIVIDAESFLAASLRVNWARIARLPQPARGALATMLHNAKPLRLLRNNGDARTGAAAPDAVALRRALAAGTRRLRALQASSGELATEYSTDPTMAAPVCVRSPFISGVVALALRAAGDGELPAVAARALRFISTARRGDGTIAFFASGIDPDLDDTCLLNALLQEHGIGGVDYARLAHRIAALPAREGLFHTWLRADGAANDIDPVVTVNVVRFLAQNGIACRDAAAAARRAFARGDLDAGSLYYVSWAALPYFASSLVPFARRWFDEDPRWRAKLHGALERPVSDVAENAMALTLALRSHAAANVADRLAAVLLGAQRDDGGWPSCATFRAFNFWGSEALSTALALEALHSFERRRPHRP